MTTGQVQSESAPVEVSVEDTSARCAVCAHDLEAHDAIGRRFCEATQAQALSRTCICRPA
jgi:hypothetical protein